MGLFSVPLIAAGNSFPCPWSSSDLGVWQATVGNSSACDGNESSVFSLQETYVQINLCQDTNNAAGKFRFNCVTFVVEVKCPIKMESMSWTHFFQKWY